MSDPVHELKCLTILHSIMREVDQNPFVYEFPLIVAEPSPLVKVSDRAENMMDQLHRVLVRTTLIVVIDDSLREKDRAVFLMDPAGQVGILRIKENTFVKKADLTERIGPEEHKTSRQKRNFHDFVVPRKMHFIPVIEPV